MTAATTPLQQQTIADTAANWSQTVDFAQFDPSLGALSGVAFGLAGDVTGSIVLDNLDRAPAAFAVAFDGSLNLAAPDGSPLTSVAPTANAATTLAAGASTTLAGISGSAGTTSDYQPSTQPGGPAVAPFVGTGSVPLSLAAQAALQVSGPGNMLVDSQAAAGASVTMEYGYVPATTAAGYGVDGDDYFSLEESVDLSGISLMPTATLTTAAQTFSFADRSTAWNDSLAVNPFDPALGTLQSVNITLTGNLLARFSAENLGATAAVVSADDTATLTLDLPAGATAAAATSVSDSMSLAAFDGSADFAGRSGHSDNLTGQGLGSTDTVTDAADLAAFSGRHMVVLPIEGTSAATIDGPGNLMAGLLTEAGGTVSVSYTYLPTATGTSSDVAGTTGAADYSVFDATTSQPAAVTPQSYAGGAGGPTQQLTDNSGDNLDVSVTSDNWVIGTGAGNDVIVANGGNNILCGGGGSNLLVGAGGDDTFAVHGGGGDAWSAVENFHAGDWLLVTGLSSQTAALTWFNGQGGIGLTLDATAPDGSATLVTLAHYYSTADLANGRLSTGFGDGFFYVHANS